MYIFLVPYWLPFPSSEYGGLQCVIAKDEDHALEILSSVVDDYLSEAYPDYRECIKDVLINCKRYRLDRHVKYDEGIVKEFLT